MHDGWQRDGALGLALAAALMAYLQPLAADYAAWVCSEDARGSWHTDTVPGGIAISPDGTHIAQTVKAEECFVVLDGVAGPTFSAIHGRRRDGAITPAPVFSPDSRHLACIGSRDGKDYVVVDGVAGEPWDLVPGWVGGDHPGSIFFSPDGQRVAHAAQRDGQHLVVVDGRIYGPYTRVSMPVFSPDGRHVAFAAGNAEAHFVVLDGTVVLDRREGRPFELAGDPVFSPDSSRVGYMARVGKQWCMVVDGRAGPLFDSVVNPVFSAGGERVAYWGSRKLEGIVVVDGVEHPKCREPAFGPAGIRAAWKCYAPRKGNSCVVVDGVAGEDYGDIRQSDLLFSHDGRRLAYLAGGPLRQRVVCDGKPSPLYAQVVGLQFAPKTARLVYAAAIDQHWTAVVEGEPLPPVKGIRDVTVSPDGTRVAFVAEREGRKQAGACDQTLTRDFDVVLPPVFSSDGRHVAFAAREGSRFRLVLDGNEGKGRYERVNGLGFTPDGRYLLCLAAMDGRWFIAGVDGPLSPAVDQFCAEFIAFDEAGVARALASRGMDIFLLTARPKTP